MSNLITATIYQIDGSPLLQSATVDFQVSDILIKEASINIPQVQSVIFVYNVPNNQLGGKAYYAGEDVATLVASANDALVALTQATILEINGDPQPPGGIQCAFPSQEIIISEDIRPSGVNSAIQYNGTTYYASETQATLVANSNDLSGIVLNQLDVPAFRADTLANLPAPGQQGLMFIATDTYAFYRDNGASWDLIGGPGTGTVTGSGAATQVAFWNGASVVSGSSNLFWDSANNRLGIGTASPANTLDVTGAARITGNLTVTSNINTSLTTGSVPFIGASGILTQDNSQLFWDSANNRLGIGVAAPAYKLDISGVTNIVGASAGAVLRVTQNTGWSGTQYTIDANGYSNFGGIRISGAETARAIMPTSSAMDIGIATSGNRAILFTQSGTDERMRIAQGGNVLIGRTTDNGVKLQVQGGADVTGTINCGPLGCTTIQASSTIFGNTIQGNTGNLNIQSNLSAPRYVRFVTTANITSAVDPFSFYTGNTVAGIGTDSVNLINVNPTINQTTGTGTIYGYRFNPTNTAVLSTVYAFYADSGLSYFGGNVGIGTTSPGTILHLSRADGLTQSIRISTSFGSTNINSGAGFTNIDAGGAAHTISLSTLGVTRFQTVGTTGYSSVTGGLSVGTTTNAGFSLDVNGTGRIQGQFSVVDLGVTFRASKQSGFNSVDFFSSTSEFSFNNGSGVTIQVPGVTFRHAYAGLTFNGLANSSFVNFKESTTNNSIFYVKNGDTQQWNWAKNLKIDGGTTASECAASSILELSSTTKGFLPPRMTNAQMTAIASPATGLMVYDTTNNKVNVYNGTAWEALH